jgi:N6-L-threonylcarbamoyladenine synthase
MAKGQAERLLGLCQDLLEDTGHSFENVNIIGVGIGPGNFTGIRITVSAARGLALGLGIPAVGVNAFDAMRQGFSGPCTCAVDARRGQVFLQSFDGSDTNEPTLHDADALPSYVGPLFGSGGLCPPLPIAEAIAQIAAERATSTVNRPAPLYLRPADAAPARDTAPRILS